MKKLDKKEISKILKIYLLPALLLIGFAIYFGYQRNAMQREREQYAQLEKERMEEELLQLEEAYGIQAEKIRTGSGYGEQYMHLASDSLLEQLGREKAKVQRLSDELRLTKAADAKKIKQLSEEVTSLRKVLRSYVVQVDSLQSINTALRAENEKVKKDFTEASRAAGELRKEKETLTRQVTLAAKLDLSGVSCTPLDKRGKKTSRLNRITHLRFDFTLLRNVSAEVGMRKIFIRILNPNDMPMTSAGAGDFSYEGVTLAATASKQIEYGGEDLPETIYWSVDQTLLPGRYRADFFADGDRIGQLTFFLE